MQGPEAKPETDTARIFLALHPGQAVQAALHAHVRDWHWPVEAVRYAEADWHVTLHFIGQVERTRLSEVRLALESPMTPFELRFGEPSLWPHGLAVLLPIGIPPALKRLHDALGLRLRRLGLHTDERAYRPHLTLARRASQAVPPVQLPAWGWQVRGYALMASTGEASQRYRVLQQYGESDDSGALLA